METTRKKILSNLKRTLLTAIIASIFTFAPGLKANATAVYEKDKSNIQSFINRNFYSDSAYTLEIDRINKKLDEAIMKYNIPLTKVIMLRTTVSAYEAKLYTSKTLKPEDIAKLYLRKYEEEVDKLIDENRTDKDFTFKITDSQWFKNLQKNTTKLYDKMEDKGKSFLNLAELMGKAYNKISTGEENGENEAYEYIIKEIMRIETKLYKADVPFLKIEALNGRTIKKALKLISQNNPEDPETALKVKQLLNEYEKEADLLIEGSQNEKNKDVERFTLSKSSNDIDSLFDEVYKIDGTFYLTESESVYLYEGVEKKIETLRDKINKLIIKSKKALDRNKISTGEYQNIRNFCDDIEKEIDKIIELSRYKSRREVKRRLKKLIDRVNRVLGDSRFMDTIKKIGAKTFFFGLLSFFFLSVIPVPAALITSFFGGNFMANLMRNIIRRCREVNADFITTYDDYFKKQKEEEKKLSLYGNIATV